MLDGDKERDAFAARVGELPQEIAAARLKRLEQQLKEGARPTVRDL